MAVHYILSKDRDNVTMIYPAHSHDTWNSRLYLEKNLALTCSWVLLTKFEKLQNHHLTASAIFAIQRSGPDVPFKLDKLILLSHRESQPENHLENTP